MNLLRGSIVITSLCLIAIAMVALRGAQTRAASHALRLELQQVEAKRTLWRVQAAIARLRAPNEIRHRVKLLDDKPKPADSESVSSVDCDPMPNPERSLQFLPPSLTRRGWGRFFPDRMTPLDPPLARGEESQPTVLETALASQTWQR